jgi:adenine deaminase
MKETVKISGQIVDVVSRKIFPGTIFIKNGKIESVVNDDNIHESQYILPGFVDSHIHIESSLLSPQQFAQIAVRHGTVATVSDPHEIANVLGPKGIEFMVEDGKKVPLKFHFGIPSCVPATPFETAGAVIDSEKIADLLKTGNYYFLAEMMNFPGVINEDKEVLKKLELAKQYNLPIDGHAPGVRGNDLRKYIDHGVVTDHECEDYDEAEEKIKAGMKIQIREGSAAKSFDILIPLLKKYPESIMFCSDDRHPDDLIQCHINDFVKRAVSKNYDLFDTLRAATLNPVNHYKLQSGLLQEKDPADFILVDNLKDFNIKSTYIKGKPVFAEGKTRFGISGKESPNIMNAKPIDESDLRVTKQSASIRSIVAFDNQLFTDVVEENIESNETQISSKPEKDLLKIVVYNRYKASKPAIGFVKNFGLKEGAIASSIAHDSHNLIAVGASDEEIRIAINGLIKQMGGIVAVKNKSVEGLPLEIGGLMTHAPVEKVSEKYVELTRIAQQMGCSLNAPFMTLAFMALPVIPKLKITDQGLFDVTQFKYVDLFL